MTIFTLVEVRRRPPTPERPKIGDLAVRLHIPYELASRLRYSTDTHWICATLARHGAHLKADELADLVAAFATAPAPHDIQARPGAPRP